MEIQNEDGSTTLLKPGTKTQFGRNLGFQSTDPTVSRHHVNFHFHKSNSTVEFQVTGKNPIWVQSSKYPDISVYKRFEKGEMEPGDRFCISAKDPVWFSLKNVGMELDSEDELDGIQDLDIEAIDISDIDPVKEFSFVVMGHDFDGYSKKMMIDIKNWNWFLEQPEQKSDDDDDGERKRKNGLGRKRKKNKGEENDDDDEWTGDSEDDKEIVLKLRKVQGPKYSTRSKDKTVNGTKVAKNRKKPNTSSNQDDNEDEDEEEEDDETLGGFIAEDDDVAEEELESDEEEEEEEEFEDDEEEE